MVTMRAVDIKNGTGSADALFINDKTDRPTPQGSEILVKVRAFGLNRMDLLQREGHYPVPPQAPKTLGVEFSGTVEEIGEGADEEERHTWKKGDEVFGLAYGGAYAEYIVVSKKMVLRKPKELSWEVCAGTCEVWFTALQALYLVGEYSPETHKSILWHAGASSVSIAGIQLSLAASGSSTPAKVYATARQDEKCDFVVEKLGATGGVNATKNDGKWSKEVLSKNGGEGMDLVIDFVGAPYFPENLAVCAKDGRVVTLGNMGGSKLPEGVDISAFVMKRVRYQGSTLRSRDPEYQGKLRDLFEEKALPQLKSGKFEVHIEKVMPWEQIKEAHQLMESNKTKGKIICTIG